MVEVERRSERLEGGAIWVVVIYSAVTLLYAEAYEVKHYHAEMQSVKAHLFVLSLCSLFA